MATTKRKVGFDTSTVRKRGAQPENASALEHGFYAKTFTAEELVEIGRLAVANLSMDEEIAMLRVLMRRLVESDSGIDDVVELFGRATGQLRRLIRSRDELLRGGQDTGSVADAYERALDELADELGVEV